MPCFQREFGGDIVIRRNEKDSIVTIQDMPMIDFCFFSRRAGRDKKYLSERKEGTANVQTWMYFYCINI